MDVTPSPGLTPRQIIEFVRDAYGRGARTASLVPGRTHAVATAYRVDCAGDSYFLKLSPDVPEPQTLARYLADSGIGCVVAPLRARDGQLSARIRDLSAALYP